MRRHADRGNYYDILEQDLAENSISSTATYVPSLTGKRAGMPPMYQQQHSRVKTCCRGLFIFLLVAAFIVFAFLLYSTSVRANYAESYAFSLDQRLSLLERNYTATYAAMIEQQQK